MQLARTLCLTLGLFAIAACGGSLEDSCKDSCDRVCDGQDAPTDDEVATCKTSCSTAAANAKKAGCEDQADKLQSCGDDNACDAAVNSACQDEIAAYARCAASYCASHTDDAICTQ